MGVEPEGWRKVAVERRLDNLGTRTKRLRAGLRLRMILARGPVEPFKVDARD